MCRKGFGNSQSELLYGVYRRGGRGVAIPEELFSFVQFPLFVRCFEYSDWAWVAEFILLLVVSEITIDGTNSDTCTMQGRNNSIGYPLHKPCLLISSSDVPPS